jgi:hypothetical protein
MKIRRGSYFVLTLFLISFILLTSFVAAQSTVGDTANEKIKETLTEAIEKLKVREFLTSILLGILLWIVLYSIVKQVFSFSDGAGGWAAAGVSLIIVILTFVYIPEQLIEVIALQYTALGATILTIIPFILLLYFTVMVSKSRLVAKIIWIFYIIYYTSIFIYTIFNQPAQETPWTIGNIFAGGAVLAGIIMFTWLGWFRKKAFEEQISAKEELALRGVRLREVNRKAAAADDEAHAKDLQGAGSST